MLWGVGWVRSLLRDVGLGPGRVGVDEAQDVLVEVLQQQLSAAVQSLHLNLRRQVAGKRCVGRDNEHRGPWREEPHVHPSTGGGQRGAGHLAYMEPLATPGSVVEITGPLRL